MKPRQLSLSEIHLSASCEVVSAFWHFAFQDTTAFRDGHGKQVSFEIFAGSALDISLQLETVKGELQIWMGMALLGQSSTMWEMGIGHV